MQHVKIIKRILVIFLLGLLYLPATGLGQAQTAERISSDVQASEELPNLGYIIPLANQLAERLTRLQNALLGLSNTSADEKKFVEFKKEVEDVAARLQLVKNSGDRKWYQLAELRRELQDIKTLSGEIDKPLTRSINLLAGWKQDWQVEKRRWNDLEKRLLMDHEFPQLDKALTRAEQTIATAQKLILQQLDTMLEIQAKEGAVRAKAEVLAAEIKTLISAGRSEYFFSVSPPMYSLEYFSQFRSELWQTTLANITPLSLPTSRYFAQHGKIFMLLSLLFLTLIIIILRNRSALNASERWRIFSARPYSSSFFVVAFLHILLPQYLIFPISLRPLFAIAMGCSFARILGSLVEDSWKKQAAVGLVLIYTASIVITAMSLSLPLYRLYILLVSLLVLFFLFRWSRENRRLEGHVRYVWFFRLGYILFGVIAFTELQGKEGIASRLFNATILSLVEILAFTLLVYLIRGGLQWFFSTPFVRSFKQLRSDVILLSRRTEFLILAIIVGFVLLPLLLTVWGVYEGVSEATTGMMSAGFNLGSERISVGLLLAAAGTLYGSLLLSWILPKVLMDDMIAGSGLERGVRISISRLIHYFLVFIGLLLTLSILGLDVTKLTIILSALGVGIGFGLQGIVNNFFSGLVLLFERPVRVGDCIEINGIWAVIKRIGLRSTTVQTVESADVIIPNADLISKELTNWTLSNRQVRLAVPVGVAYGSDVFRLMEILLACAKEHTLIVKSPSPRVLFKGFGESSLDFELMAWVNDVDDRLQVKSELHIEIDRKFREASIEIAFPQRDLHLRSVDTAVPLGNTT